MSKVTTSSFFKFDSISAYAGGLAALTETLQKWAETADEGYARTYQLTENIEDLKVQMNLSVDSHQD